MVLPENVFVKQDGKGLTVILFIVHHVTQLVEFASQETVHVFNIGLDFFVTYQPDHVLETDFVVLMMHHQEVDAITLPVNVFAILDGKELFVTKNLVL